MKTLVLCAGFLLASAMLQAAGAEPARAPGAESAALSFTTTGRVRFEDPDDPALGGRVSVQEAAVLAPLAHRQAGAWSLAAGGWAGWTRLDFDGYPGVDTEDLYGLAGFLAAERPSGKGWGWAAMVMPGFFTDFREGRTGEGKVVFHAEANYPVSSSLRLHVGAAYDTAFGDPAVYPVGGVAWQALDELAVRLVFPAPSVYWAPSDRLGLFALLQPAGDRWIVDDDEAGEQVFLIECWRAGLGAEHRLFKDVWLRVMGGMDAERRYEVRSGDRKLLDEPVDDTWFASVSLVLY